MSNKERVKRHLFLLLSLLFPFGLLAGLLCSTPNLYLRKNIRVNVTDKLHTAKFCSGKRAIGT